MHNIKVLKKVFNIASHVEKLTNSFDFFRVQFEHLESYLIMSRHFPEDGLNSFEIELIEKHLLVMSLKSKYQIL